MVNQINENALSVYTMINISINSRGLKRVRMKENLNSFISEKHFLPSSYYPRGKFTHHTCCIVSHVLVWADGRSQTEGRQTRSRGAAV